MNNHEFAPNGIGGYYCPKIEHMDGSVSYPYGSGLAKNMILDDFFDKYLQGSNAHTTPQAVMQTMLVGSGIGSNTAPSRTQTGIMGQIAGTTYASTMIDRNIITGGNQSLITCARDFTFDTFTGAPSMVVNEAVVGSFNTSSIPDCSLSRFVFPTGLQVNYGDKLSVYYKLDINMNFYAKSQPIYLAGNGLNFDGYVRYGGNGRSMHTATTTSEPNNKDIHVQYGGNDYKGTYRNFTINSRNHAVNNWYDHTCTFGGMSLLVVNSYANKIGFFSVTHAPSIYPSDKSAYTAMGPLGNFPTKSNYIKTDQGASVDLTYFYPAHTSDRNDVGGVYLFYYSLSYSRDSLYIKFDTPQTIPAGQSVNFTLRYSFGRL